MSKHKIGLLGAVIATGAVIGAWATARFYESKLVTGEAIIQNVRKLFSIVGTVEGSWIEMEPVFVELEDFSGYVYYGGITRKEQDELVQYEFYADAKTGAVLDLYKIA